MYGVVQLGDRAGRGGEGTDTDMPQPTNIQLSFLLSTDDARRV